MAELLGALGAHVPTAGADRDVQHVLRILADLGDALNLHERVGRVGIVDTDHDSRITRQRMALGWLDVVRFADTAGYHSDNPRNVWPYRDWVIRSFNGNKRFDRFTLEQIAGDLLPADNNEERNRLLERLADQVSRFEVVASRPLINNGLRGLEHLEVRVQRTGSPTPADALPTA